MIWKQVIYLCDWLHRSSLNLKKLYIRAIIRRCRRSRLSSSLPAAFSFGWKGAGSDRKGWMTSKEGESSFPSQMDKWEGGIITTTTTTTTALAAINVLTGQLSPFCSNDWDMHLVVVWCLFSCLVWITSFIFCHGTPEHVPKAARTLPKMH